MKKILLVAVLTLFTFALKAQQYHNGHQYVDLGLSVKWATCNVGADSPEEYGNYYAWGETSPKTNYTWDTYKWSKGLFNNTITKYCTEYDYGEVDNKTTLELKDDAARVNWGGKWRMPTLDELYELTNNCTWDWTTRRGVNGYKVTSEINGNSIFLPVAGFRDGDNLNNVGSDGYYWSSSLHMEYSDFARYLTFDSSGGVGWLYLKRCCGLSVRAVCE